VRLALLAALLLVGCGPLSYIVKDPILPPDPLPGPTALTVPVIGAEDCGAFTLEGSTWTETPWTQPGVKLDTVEVGDLSPVVDELGRVRCRHLVISPSWWTTARESRDIHPSLIRQIELWRGYAERQGARQQEEAEAIRDLVKMARRRQIESFAIGGGVGAASVVALVLVVVLSR
jgi:hypothetical protein